MIIKLTKTGYSTVGHSYSKKLDKKIQAPVWVNTDYIATMKQTSPSKLKGVEGEVLTEIVWGAGRYGEHIFVSETPEEILEQRNR